MTGAPTAVVLLQMGGPESLDGVEPFLFNLFRDNDLIPLPAGWLWQRQLARLISRRRAREVREYYRHIGGRSPLGDITREQARLLEEELARRGRPECRCVVAMRYAPPLADEAVRAVAAMGARTLVALTLYPHYTTATTGSSLWDLRGQLAGKPPAAGAIDLLEIDRWPAEPRYLDALTDCVRRGLDGFPAESRDEVELLFSAHGLPMSFIKKGDPYVEHLQETIAGVLERLAVPNPHRLAYQSKVGPVRWLEPSTPDALRALAAAGRRRVLIVPIAFVSDHIETLYEIDVLFAEEARTLGIELRRAPGLNTHPLFVAALADLVERRLAQAAAGRGSP